MSKVKVSPIETLAINPPFSDEHLKDSKFKRFNPHIDFDMFGYTTLTLAAKTYNISEIRRLIHCELVDVNRVDGNNKTAIMYFADKFLDDGDKDETTKDVIEELLLGGALYENIPVDHGCNFIETVIGERGIELSPPNVVTGVRVAVPAVRCYSGKSFRG